ncbi:GNAT family N-acetyltransferase [Azospirillum endophyticum]
MPEQAQVTLAPLGEAHLARSLSWINSDSVRDGLLVDRLITIQEHRAWFAALNRDELQAVFAASATGIHVGNFGYRHLAPKHGTGEMWMFLGPEHQKRGLAFPMLKAGISKGFSSLGLRKIVLHVAIGNARAVSIYARAGFQVEGVLRAEQMYRGQPMDLLRMALFASDEIRK